MTKHKAHIYFLQKTKKSSFYKCEICPHYSMPETVIGRLAECKFCHKEYTMTLRLRGKDRLRKNPHCGCRFTVYKPIDEKKIDLGSVDDLISEMVKK